MSLYFLFILRGMKGFSSMCYFHYWTIRTIFRQTNLFPCAEKCIFHLSRSVVNQLLRTCHKGWYSTCTMLILTLETWYNTTNINTANKPAPPYNSQNHLIHLYNGDCVRCKVRTTCLHTINTNFVLLSPFQGSDRLSPSSRQGGPGSTLGPIRMRSAVDKVAVGRVFLRVLQFPLTSIIPPMLHPYLHLHAALTINIGREYLGTFKKSNAHPDIRRHWNEQCSRSKKARQTP
jgi:hypothetical protein